MVLLGRQDQADCCPGGQGSLEGRGVHKLFIWKQRDLPEKAGFTE